MIDLTQHEFYWPLLDDAAEPVSPVVFSQPAERLSALLGPDGAPLMVAYPRPRLGFDLSTRSRA